MPYKDPKKQAAYRRHWRQTHKEQIREYKKQDYEKHRTERLAHSKENHQRARLKVLTHYSISEILQCARCGITDIDVLCIDHINGGGTKHREHTGKDSGSMFYHWLIKNNFPEGFQILCCNCNYKKLRTEGK